MVATQDAHVIPVTLKEHFFVSSGTSLFGLNVTDPSAASMSTFCLNGKVVLTGQLELACDEFTSAL